MAMKYKASLDDYRAVAEGLVEIKRLNKSIDKLMMGKFPKSVYNAWQIGRYIDDTTQKLSTRIRKENPPGYLMLSDEEKCDFFWGGEN